MNKRIYLVTNKAGASRLIDATSKAQAVAFVAAQEYSANVASSRELVEFCSMGIKVEDANPAEKEPE